MIPHWRGGEKGEAYKLGRASLWDSWDSWDTWDTWDRSAKGVNEDEKTKGKEKGKGGLILPLERI
jgi:hypothetical protein